MLQGALGALNVNELELSSLKVELAERLHRSLKAEEPEGERELKGERELEANDEPWGQQQGGQDGAGGDSAATAARAAAAATAWRLPGTGRPYVMDTRDPVHQAGGRVRLRLWEKRSQRQSRKHRQLFPPEASPLQPDRRKSASLEAP